MKTNHQSTFRVCRLGLGVLTLLATIQFNLPCIAQVTAFTYQGRLNDANNPANGLYDLQFTLYLVATGSGSIAGPLTRAATPVTNGLFTVTIDFGAAAFPGFDRWLEIAARTNGSGSFATLSPRQALTPTPYAITAQNLVSGGLFGNPVNFNNPNNSFSGNGGGLTNVNATTLGGFDFCALPCYWNLTGNAGTVPGLNFLGTTDNQPLTLKVNNSVALRIDPAPNGPNMVGGLGTIQPTVISNGVRGAVVAGGGAPVPGHVNGFGAGDFHGVYDSDCTIGGGFGNRVGNGNADVNDAAFGTIGGGVFNYAANYASTVAGGDGNLAAGVRAAIGGGFHNQALSDESAVGGGGNNIIATNSPDSFIGGGSANLVSGSLSVISGGANNSINQGAWSVIPGGANNLIHSANWSVIPGGQSNEVFGNWDFAAGQRAKAHFQGCFVWADSSAADFASTDDDQFCIRASGGIQVEPSTRMFFGSQTRQMLNLWGSAYGIGVQSSTEYFRSDFDFCWFKGGFHNDAQHNPGTGGAEMMRLDSGGNLKISGAFGSLSDRNAKEKFEPISPRAVLEKVAALPLSRWSYKTDPETRHVGPMAQDFYAAFDVGTDDRHIGLGDEGGVALAAIQGLNEKMESENAHLRQQLNREQEKNAELKQRLERLEKLMLDKTSN
jgi:trimeric autotransporter adhesin